MFLASSSWRSGALRAWLGTSWLAGLLTLGLVLTLLWQAPVRGLSGLLTRPSGAMPTNVVSVPAAMAATPAIAHEAAALAAAAAMNQTHSIGAREAMAPTPAQRPLEELLTAEGTLDLSTGFSGSLDPTGWQLSLGSDGAPRFVRAGLAAAGVVGAAVVGAGLPGGEPATALAASGDEYWSSSSLNAVPTGSYITAMAVDGDHVYVGGMFSMIGNIRANNVARWSATAGWEPLGYGVSGIVWALAVESGTVYAGGAFANLCADSSCSSGMQVNNVARWNSATGWSGLGNGLNTTVQALAVSGSTLYAGGALTLICADSGCTSGTSVHNIAQWNSTTGWSSVGYGLNETVWALTIGSDGTLYAGGDFIGICTNVPCTPGTETPVNYIAQWNSTDGWTGLGHGVNNTVYALEISGDTLYVGGSFGGVCTNSDCSSGTPANRVASWSSVDGWAALGNGVDLPVRALEVSGTDLYVGGQFSLICEDPTCTIGGPFALRAAKWSSTGGWAPLGVGVNDHVLALALSGGQLFVGGGFTAACSDTSCTDSVPANGLIRWSGTAWEPMPISGMAAPQAAVHAVAVGDRAVYIGGTFDWIGSLRVNGVAKWDGASWSALGHGFKGEVLALAVSGNTLYAGGAFTARCDNSSCSSSTPMNRIAQWNGTTWSPLDHGLSAEVHALVTSGTALYAGGNFDAICANAACTPGMTVNRVAKWENDAWSPLSNGLNGSVNALAVGNGTLYAGGSFTAACADSSCTPGTPLSYIGQWNGSSWSAVGYGLDAPVNALGMANGTLYAGGVFSNACADAVCTPGTRLRYIGQWNGSSWSPMGHGLNDAVNTLAVGEDTLYAGGAFTAVCADAACTPGTQVSHVAAWRSGAWSALGSGVDSMVLSSAATRTGLYVGGTFYVAGDKVSPFFSAYSPLADLRPTLTSSASSVALGSPVTLYLRVEDQSGSATPGALVTATLPSGLTLSNVTASQGSCSGTGLVVCSLGAMDPWTTAWITLTTSATGLGSQVTTASAGSSSKPALANTASVTVTVNAPATPMPTSTPPATATPTATSTPPATPTVVPSLTPWAFFPIFPHDWVSG